MNIRNHPDWSILHEARLQTLLHHQFLLEELQKTEPDQKESGYIFDLENHKRSAEQVLNSLMSVTPSEGGLNVANAMWEKH